MAPFRVDALAVNDLGSGICYLPTMTHYTAADLAMAERHVASGERHIVRQEELLTSLRTGGFETAEAERLLKLMNETQVLHFSHRNAIAAALEEMPAPL